MKEFKKYIIPVLLTAIFIAIMTTGGLIKRPFNQNDNVKGYIEKVKKDVEEEKWEKAKQDLDKLKSAWKIVEKRVQFSVERDEMISIDRNIARIKGALEVQDKISAIVELSEVNENWDDLEK
ncbi:MAG: DUF4363 family protein [Clostridiaceae bacterium]|nr:DUF4363 family protein [Clostridiaceae bacterium]